jgi:hypothetical protein
MNTTSAAHPIDERDPHRSTADSQAQMPNGNNLDAI